MGGPAVADGVPIKATDNFLQCKFEIDGQTWVSSEQYFQAAKFDPTNPVVAMIRKEHDGLKQWTIGSNARGMRSDWDVIRVDVMYKANYEKFRQNEDLRKALLATGNAEFKLHGTSPFWALWNAKILALVREQFKPDSERNEAIIAGLQDEMRNYREGEMKKGGK
eukprot:PhF_6_TR34696/c0_g1_i1/m.50489/K09935/K09935; uncharacterized protein